MNTTPPAVTAERAIAETRAWMERAVVGLNLCPFAKAPLVKGQVRFEAHLSDDPRLLFDDLCAEMDALVAADPVLTETTLLIHPNALVEFADFNDFLEAADAALEDRGLTGVLQVASFHPDYRFDGTEADDLGNATNRSPYPTLHLLREASVEKAVAAFPDTADAADVYERNIETLTALGPAGWRQLWVAQGAAITEGPEEP